MVNLRKEENKRKPISLIKTQTNKNINDSTINIQCESLLPEFEPRTKHPVYSANQFEHLNEQRIKYKDPEKFDVFPGLPPQNLNYPAVPPTLQTVHQNNQKPYYTYDDDSDALIEKARIRNNQIQQEIKNQVQNNQIYNNHIPNKSILSILDRKLSVFEMIIIILIVMAIAFFLVFLFESYLIFPVIFIILSIAIPIISNK